MNISRAIFALTSLLAVSCRCPLAPSPVPGEPVITLFTATPASISPGGSSRLSWSVEGATSLMLSPDPGAVTGTNIDVSPSSTTIYTLTAINVYGSTTANVTVTVTSDGLVVFPLALSNDKRYLVDKGGTPFHIQGDSAWSMIVNLTGAEIDTYLGDRAPRSFNALLVNLIDHRYGVLAPRNRAGDYPFTSHIPGSYDFSTPNEAYFAFADQAIDKAAAAGFVVFLVVLYSGYEAGEDGWWPELTNATNTLDTCYSYGQFLGNRYKSRPNIIFVLSGDYTPPAGSEGEARLLEIARGIREAGATQLMTAHISPGHASSIWSAFASFDDLYGIYPGYPPTYTYSLSLEQYAVGSKPVYLLEPGYEAEGYYEPGSPSAVRRYAWWGQLSGIAGVFYGHRDIWPFQTDSWNASYPFGAQDWRLSLGAPGAVAMSHMASLLGSLEWWRLVPSGLAGMKTLVTEGAGSDNEFVTAAAAANGSLLLAYVPTDHTGSVTIDMTVMISAVTARWWDPANGESTSLGSLPNTGTHAFTIPGNNAGGDSDWLLVLTSP